MEQKKNTHDITSSLADNNCDAFLMIGNSNNADIYYSTHFLAGDPFTYIQMKQGEESLIVSTMELNRAKMESRVSNVHTMQEYGYPEKLKERKDGELAYCDCLAAIFQQKKVRHIMVPHDFPLFTAQALKELGFSVIPAKSPFKEMRKEKASEEIEKIKASQYACEKAMEAAIGLVDDARVDNGVLYSGEEALTSETIRATIEHTLLDYGCEAESTIVACGLKSSNPHWEGEGKITVNQPIVIDIFPRSKKSRYFADMTRTVLKGEASKELVDMYEAVHAAQEAAFAVLKPGALYSEVHNAVCDEFEKRGYETIRNNSEVGFIHSTGHGVGLDIHEQPSVATQDGEVEIGHVVTIEPGLYYPELGGIRLEDMVVITEDGFENLTKMEKEFVV
ncbi:Xaa-Pro peptidase family protein [Methanococcoides sp. AM1]|uniref:M24 family metallopeptidase n=1 Tax=Methanococcoides sp. AM1 TaxID=1201011 RepID=UPI0010840996|nr:Xaa-Pro peptidase family protein [Methanococcoides sp. AM1]